MEGDKLKALDIRSAEDFLKLDARKIEYVVDQLIVKNSINMLIGDSGVGKTPLLVQLALAVATGRHWLSYTTTPGPVLFCDMETSDIQFKNYLESLSQFMGLGELPSKEQLGIWSPYFTHTPAADETRQGQIAERIREMRPSLVIIDCLRPFFPDAESKAEAAAKLLGWQREMAAKYGCAFLTVHHRRKTSREYDPPSLLAYPRDWCQEAAGSLALINQMDLRMGVEEVNTKNEDYENYEEGTLLLNGFNKAIGVMDPPEFFERVYEDEEQRIALGYQTVRGRSGLTGHQKAIFDTLPAEFRFKDVVKAYGGSKRAASKLVKSVGHFKLATRAGDSRKAPWIKNEETDAQND